MTLVLLMAMASVAVLFVANSFLTNIVADGESTPPPAVASPAVVFGAVGDFDNKAPTYPDMVALAKRLATRGGMFLLALGDLGYVADEQQWCGVIKSAFNNTLVVAGNHDTTQSGPGDINNDVVYCPFNLPGVGVVNGPKYGYGKEYYFDYPATSPLVRVIMITVGETGSQTSGQSYTPPSGADWLFTKNAITSGRTAGIPWIVVGFHKVCITAATKSCEIGQAFWDALIDAGPDLVLTGHDHVYQRSSQLAHGASCTSVASGSFNSACVVDSDASLVKGAGVVQVTDGAGGRDLYSINTAADGQYFPVYMGSNTNSQGKTNGQGALVVSLNATALTGTTNFCPLGSADSSGECPSRQASMFYDTFTISSGSPPPPPALGASFSFSPSNPIVGQSVTFTGSANGGTSPYTYAWAFGDGATGSGATATHAYATAATFTATLTVTDAASKTATASKSVVVGAAPPPLSAAFTFAPASPTVGQSVSFSGTASGGTSSYTYAWAYGDGATGTGASTSHTYASASTFTATLTVTDAASKTATASKSVVVTAASPPPTADFTFSPSSPIVGQSVTFTGSAGGGASPYTYAWTFGDGTPGTGQSIAHTYTSSATFTATLTVTDAASATATASKSVVVAPAPPPGGNPTASFTFSPTWPQAAVPVVFDASASSSPNVSATLDVRWDWTNDGTFDTTWSSNRTATYTYAVGATYTVRLQVRDSEGLMDNTTRSVPVDGILPATAASVSGTLGNSGWYRSSATVTLTPTDDLSGVAATYLRRDNASWTQGTTVTFANDRAHTLDFYSVDRAGNTERTQTIIVPVDTTPPTTTATLQGITDVNGSYVSSVNVTLTAADALSGVAWTKYRVDGASWLVYASTFTVAGSGTHLVEFNSTDVAGDAEATKSASPRIASNVPTSQPPVSTLALSGTAGLDGWYVSKVAVTLSASSPSSLAVTIAYRLDGGFWRTYASAFLVGDGGHTIDYNATDSASNEEATHTASFHVDTTPPVTSANLTGTRGRDHWWTSAVTVALTASDGVSGVASTAYRLDGGAWTPYASVLSVGSGRHVLEYRSTDVAGLVEASASVGIKVDSSPPRVTLSGPSLTLTSSPAVLTWMDVDDVAGVIENAVSVDGGPYVSVGLNETATLSLSDGTHLVRVRATDDAGNVGVAEAAVRVDTNLFSPTGPYQGVPLYLLLEAAIVIAVVAALRHRGRAKRARRQEALRRMRARSR